MATSNQEMFIFAEIQKKLFYMIPEKWEAIYLYASVIEEPRKKTTGEMYFYYIPKGILKRKPVNVYQIPGMFNIDEEGYNEIIQKLYTNIKQLREIHRKIKEQLWTNLTISIENSKFKIEYSYDNLGMNSEFSPYERHIIWRYKNLNIEPELQTKEEKEIINRYLNSETLKLDTNYKDIYVEGIYEKPVHNIIDYEKTLTLEAAIATNQEERADALENKKQGNPMIPPSEVSDTNRVNMGNQVLFNRVEEMKKISASKEKKTKKKDNIVDSDTILNSEFMTRKD